jgi:uncharacterized protein (TIGR00369 family)
VWPFLVGHASDSRGFALRCRGKPPIRAGTEIPVAGQGAAARFAFVAAEKHMNSAGSVHGGMLMGFADIAMSRTSRQVSGAPRCSTVSLTADFVGPARLGDVIEARTTVTRRSRSLVFLSAEITAGDRVILIAQGLWKIAGEA